METKTCSKCKESKLHSEFHKQSDTPDKLRTACKKCVNATNKAYRDANPEKEKARVAKYREDFPEKERARNVKYYKNNEDKERERHQRWYKENPDKHAQKCLRRKVCFKAASVSWANLELIKQLYIDRDTHTLETGITHHVDHIFPINHPLICGLHVEANLQVLTLKDNFKKRNYFRAGYLSESLDYAYSFNTAIHLLEPSSSQQEPTMNPVMLGDHM